MKIHDLVQGSLPWLQWRREGITASEIAAIMEQSPYMTPEMLFYEKSGSVSEDLGKDNFAMARGRKMEPVIRDWFNAKDEFHQYVPYCVSHDEITWARASLDGFCLTDNSLIEIKLNGSANHNLAISGELPIYHMLQVQWQLFITGARSAFYLSCPWSREIDKTIIIRVMPDFKIQNESLKKAREFYDALQAKRPPPSNVPQNVSLLLTEYEKLSLEKSIIEQKMDLMKITLRQLIPKDKTISYGSVTAAWRSRIGNVDYGKIPVLSGIDLNEFRKPSTEYLDLRVKGGDDD